MPDDTPPEVLLDAFLRAHALEGAVPAVLLAKGEDLWRRLRESPPTSPAWGRFLVALGQLTAEHLDDRRGASVYFRSALESVRLHGDGAVAVAAGFNQGVLLERGGDDERAGLAYRVAADTAIAANLWTTATLRCLEGSVRLSFARDGRLDATDRQRLKSAWLGWLWLRHTGQEPVPEDLARALGRTLAAFLLPEDDPAHLAEAWRGWLPRTLDLADGVWSDEDPNCLVALYAAAESAAIAHLADEGPDPGAPYRLLHAAAERVLKR